MKRVAPLVLLACISPLLATPARADGAPDLAEAETLFDAGKSDMAHGDYARACPKLEASLRLDVGIGAMMYLAECDRALGKTATAWGLFREAAALAASRHDAREALARDRADRLAPQLSRLAIDVSACADVPGLVVKRDDVAIDRAAWSVAVPVDPGAHAVEVSAPGKVAYRASVDVAGDAATSTVTVPALADEPPAPAPAPPAPIAASPAPARDVAPAPAAAPIAPDATPAKRPLGTRKTIALVGAGVGVVGLGLGAYLGLRAKSDLDDSNADGHCRGNLCDAFGVSARDAAQSHANAATFAFVGGAAALAAGAVLWLTAPRAATHVALVPIVGPDAGGLSIVGHLE